MQTKTMFAMNIIQSMFPYGTENSLIHYTYNQRLSNYYIRGRSLATSQFEKAIFVHNVAEKIHKWKTKFT